VLLIELGLNVAGSEVVNQSNGCWGLQIYNGLRIILGEGLDINFSWFSTSMVYFDTFGFCHMQISWFSH
jgi:hypothetical protein